MPDAAPPEDLNFDLDLEGVVIDGRYEVLSLLGKGGMGSVYLVHDNHTDCKVVIKLPDPAFLSDEGFRERFAREVESLRAIEHPHILRALDAGSYRGIPYVVVEYLPEGSVRGRIAWNAGPLPASDVASWLPGIADALDTIHERGTLHRDIKPANILFDAQDRAHIADFGIAKILEEEKDQSLTRTGQTPGSPEYMAPEVVTARRLTYAYDQYALGVVVYNALSGTLPVSGSTPLEVLVNKRTKPPRPIQEVAPELPQKAAVAVMRAVERDPEKRFPNCTAFANAFAAGLHESAGGGTDIGVPLRRAAGSPPRRREVLRPGSGWPPWKIGAMALAAVVFVVVVIVALTGDAEEPAPAPARDAKAPLLIDGGSDLTDTHLRIRGRALDEHLALVTVNSAPVTVDAEGTYEVTLPRPADADGRVVVRAIDEAGNEAEKPLRYDLPARETARPWEQALQAAESAAKNGQWVDASAHLERARAAGAPAVSVPPWLSEGIERREVFHAAREAAEAGRYDDATKAVARYEALGGKQTDLPAVVRERLAAPRLLGLAPADGAVLTAPSFTLRGTLATARPTDRVFVDGTEVPLIQNAFGVARTLAGRGTHEIVLEVRDRGAVRLRITRRVVWMQVSKDVATFLSGWAVPSGRDLDPKTGFPVRIRRTRDEGEMVLVPGGPFQMGTPDAGRRAPMPDARPRHAVTLSKAYYLDRTEVTNEQFKRFVDAEQHATTAERAGSGFGLSASGDAIDVQPGLSWKTPPPAGAETAVWLKHPVVQVSWEDARAFARWVGAALPSEAQFERALRGGAADVEHPLAGPAGRKPVGNYLGTEFVKAFPKTFRTPIGSHRDGFALAAPAASFGANPYGIHDLSGNVWEWCADHYDPGYYAGSPPTDPTGPVQGTRRVMRGGSWLSTKAELDYAYRVGRKPTSCYAYLGFRCARSLP